MELKHEFRVGIPVAEAWSTLTDVEFIAPCMPGAQLTEVDGDKFSGGVKVKVGPITAQYKGSAHFVELDEANRRIVLEATGRDSRGAGNAAAEVTAELVPDGDGTTVRLAVDLKVTGKVAQFGRGVMGDVTEKLIGQFVTALEQKLSDVGSASGGADGGTGTTAAAAGEPAEGSAGVDGSQAGDAGADGSGETGAAASGDGSGGEAADAADDHKAASATGPRKIEMAEPEPVDLLETAGRPMLKRLLAPLAVVALFLLNRRRRRRKRRQG